VDADLHILSEEVHALREALDAERKRADEAERLLKVGNREIVAEVEAIARSMGAGVGEAEYLAALHRVKQEEGRADNAERERDEARALADERGGMVASLQAVVSECLDCRGIADYAATAQAHDERVRVEGYREGVRATEWKYTLLAMESEGVDVEAAIIAAAERVS
jgi:hypothetical protein